MVYTNPDGCPFCSQNSPNSGEDGKTYIQRNEDDVQDISDETYIPDKDVKLVDVLLEDKYNHTDIADPKNFDPIPIENDYDIEPKNYLVCPKCGEKNSRDRYTCSQCGNVLPILDPNEEREALDKKVIQLLDPASRRQYYRVGLQLFIAHLLGKDRKMMCNGPLPSGGHCKNILTPLTKICSVCGRKHAYYPCIGCGYLVAISDTMCRNCGTPTYLSDVMNVINGGASGEGAERIIADLENTFGIPLKKQTIAAYVESGYIVQAKAEIESIASQIRSILEILLGYLRDFAGPKKSFGMRDSFSEIRQNRNIGITHLFDVDNPIPSEDLKQLISKREEEIREIERRSAEINDIINDNDNDENTIIIPNDDGEENEEENNGDDENEEDFWDGIQI